jgi:hypothetical protein
MGYELSMNGRTAVFLRTRGWQRAANTAIPPREPYFDTILRSDAAIDMAPLAVVTSPVIDTV